MIMLILKLKSTFYFFFKFLLEFIYFHSVFSSKLCNVSEKGRGNFSIYEPHFLLLLLFYFNYYVLIELRFGYIVKSPILNIKFLGFILTTFIYVGFEILPLR